MSLNNLSIQLSHTGDRGAALVLITEAVGIHRQLVAANPAVFLRSGDMPKSDRRGQWAAMRLAR